MTPDEIDQEFRGFDDALTKIDRQDIRDRFENVFDQAKRCPQAEAQVSALARLIMGEELRVDGTGSVRNEKDGGWNDCIEILQDEAQQILGPDWKDPLEELYKLIMGAKFLEGHVRFEIDGEMLDEVGFLVRLQTALTKEKERREELEEIFNLANRVIYDAGGPSEKNLGDLKTALDKHHDKIIKSLKEKP